MYFLFLLKITQLLKVSVLPQGQKAILAVLLLTTNKNSALDLSKESFPIAASLTASLARTHVAPMRFSLSETCADQCSRIYIN